MESHKLALLILQMSRHVSDRVTQTTFVHEVAKLIEAYAESIKNGGSK